MIVHVLCPVGLYKTVNPLVAGSNPAPGVLFHRHLRVFPLSAFFYIGFFPIFSQLPHNIKELVAKLLILMIKYQIFILVTHVINSFKSYFKDYFE